MRLHALPFAFTPLRDVTCVSCGSLVRSPDAVEDRDAHSTYCLFCADMHDKFARQRHMQEIGLQFDRLPQYRKVQIQEALSLGRGNS